MRRWPSKWNGLVTTPTVRMPMSRAVLAMTGAAPVPVPPPMPAVTNTMLAPERWSRISSSTSCGRGRADIRLRTGAEALGDLGAHLDDALRLRHGERLRVGVGDDEIDALQSGGDHVVDGVAAGSADAEDGDARLQLADVRGSKIECHGCLSITTRALVRPGRRPRELVKVEGLRKRFIRSPREAIVRPFRNSRQSLS